MMRRLLVGVLATALVAGCGGGTVKLAATWPVLTSPAPPTTVGLAVDLASAGKRASVSVDTVDVFRHGKDGGIDPETKYFVRVIFRYAVTTGTLRAGPNDVVMQTASGKRILPDNGHAPSSGYARLPGTAVLETGQSHRSTFVFDTPEEEGELLYAPDGTVLASWGFTGND
jgi:hypothetical protein